MIKMPVAARIPVHWIRAVDGCTMIIPMPARSSKTRELYSVFMDLETRELRCDCPGFLHHGSCFHVNWLPRACYKHGRVRGVQDTSLDAYYALAPEVLGEQQRELLEVLREKGPLTDRQLSEALSRARHLVTARRNELMDAALVREAGLVVDPVTHVTVHLWEAA